jgi:hypothetical protein
MSYEREQSATKCDDISCSEVIRALQLEDDPVLEDIESRIDQYHEEMEVWKEEKTEAERGCKCLYAILAFLTRLILLLSD